MSATLATAAGMNGFIYRATLSMTGTANNKLFTPAFRFLYLSRTYAHVGGIWITTVGTPNDTSSAANMPWSGNPVNERMYWAVPTGTNQYADGQAASTIAYYDDPDGRDYFMEFDCLQTETNDSGIVYLNHVKIEKMARPGPGTVNASWGTVTRSDGNIVGLAFNNGSGTVWTPATSDATNSWGLGTSHVGATSVTLAMQSGHTSVFQQVNPALNNALTTNTGTGFPSWVTNQLMRVSYSVAISDKSLSPDYRMNVVAYHVPLTAYIFGNTQWTDEFHPSAYRTLPTPYTLTMSAGGGYPLSPTIGGSLVETYVYTMNAPTDASETPCILVPLLDIDASAGVSYPQAGWATPTGTFSILGCAMETLSTQ
jgi:hypothetical protein